MEDYCLQQTGQSLKDYSVQLTAADQEGDVCHEEPDEICAPQMQM